MQDLSSKYTRLPHLKRVQHRAIYMVLTLLLLRVELRQRLKSVQTHADAGGQQLDLLKVPCAVDTAPCTAAGSPPKAKVQQFPATQLVDQSLAFQSIITKSWAMLRCTAATAHPLHVRAPSSSGSQHGGPWLLPQPAAGTSGPMNMHHQRQQVSRCPHRPVPTAPGHTHTASSAHRGQQPPRMRSSFAGWGAASGALCSDTEAQSKEELLLSAHFSTAASQIIAAAQQEARGQGAPTAQVPHLLIALLDSISTSSPISCSGSSSSTSRSSNNSGSGSSASPVAAAVEALRHCGVDVHSMRMALKGQREGARQAGTAPPSSVSDSNVQVPPRSPELNVALFHALWLSLGQGAACAGPEHLLAAIVAPGPMCPSTPLAQAASSLQAILDAVADAPGAAYHEVLSACTIASPQLFAGVPPPHLLPLISHTALGLHSPLALHFSYLSTCLYPLPFDAAMSAGHVQASSAPSPPPSPSPFSSPVSSAASPSGRTPTPPFDLPASSNELRAGTPHAPTALLMLAWRLQSSSRPPITWHDLIKLLGIAAGQRALPSPWLASKVAVRMEGLATLRPPSPAEAEVVLLLCMLLGISLGGTSSIAASAPSASSTPGGNGGSRTIGSPHLLRTLCATSLDTDTGVRSVPAVRRAPLLAAYAWHAGGSGHSGCHTASVGVGEATTAICSTRGRVVWLRALLHEGAPRGPWPVAMDEQAVGSRLWPAAWQLAAIWALEQLQWPELRHATSPAICAVSLMPAVQLLERALGFWSMPHSSSSSTTGPAWSSSSGGSRASPGALGTVIGSRTLPSAGAQPAHILHGLTTLAAWHSEGSASPRSSSGNGGSSSGSSGGTRRGSGGVLHDRTAMEAALHSALRRAACVYVGWGGTPRGALLGGCVEGASLLAAMAQLQVPLEPVLLQRLLQCVGAQMLSASCGSAQLASISRSFVALDPQGEHAAASPRLAAALGAAAMQHAHLLDASQLEAVVGALVHAQQCQSSEDEGEGLGKKGVQGATRAQTTSARGTSSPQRTGQQGASGSRSPTPNRRAGAGSGRADAGKGRVPNCHEQRAALEVALLRAVQRHVLAAAVAAYNVHEPRSSTVPACSTSGGTRSSQDEGGGDDAAAAAQQVARLVRGMGQLRLTPTAAWLQHMGSTVQALRAAGPTLQAAGTGGGEGGNVVSSAGWDSAAAVRTALAEAEAWLACMAEEAEGPGGAATNADAGGAGPNIPGKNVVATQCAPDEQDGENVCQEETHGARQTTHSPSPVAHTATEQQDSSQSASPEPSPSPIPSPFPGVTTSVSNSPSPPFPESMSSSKVKPAAPYAADLRATPEARARNAQVQIDPRLRPAAMRLTAADVAHALQTHLPMADLHSSSSSKGLVPDLFKVGGLEQIVAALGPVDGTGSQGMDEDADGPAVCVHPTAAGAYLFQLAQQYEAAACSATLGPAASSEARDRLQYTAAQLVRASLPGSTQRHSMTTSDALVIVCGAACMGVVVSRDQLQALLRCLQPGLAAWEAAEGGRGLLALLVWAQGELQAAAQRALLLELVEEGVEGLGDAVAAARASMSSSTTPASTDAGTASSSARKHGMPMMDSSMIDSLLSGLACSVMAAASTGVRASPGLLQRCAKAVADAVEVMAANRGAGSGEAGTAAVPMGASLAASKQLLQGLGALGLWQDSHEAEACLQACMAVKDESS